VQIPHRLEEGGELPKGTVDVDLLEVRLRQSRRVLLVIVVRTHEQYSTVSNDLFFADARAALRVLFEGKFVLPARVRLPRLDDDAKLNVGIAARGQTPYGAHPAATSDRLLEPTARRGQIPQKAEDVQQIRFPGGVRSNEEDAVLKIDLDPREVLPVLQPEA